MRDSNYWLRDGRISRRTLLAATATTSAGIAAVGVVGCGDDDGTPSNQGGGAVTSPTAGGQTKPTGKVTIAIGVDPEVYDPQKIVGGGAQSFSTNVYESLVKRDPTGKIVPGLASSWQLAADGLSIDFELRRDAKFHNGDSFTADDVKFSVERRKDAKVNATQTLYKRIAGVDIIDPYHVKMRFTEPAIDLWSRTPPGWVYITPRRYFEQVGDAEFTKKPIGTGPYRLVNRTEKEWFELEAFEDYYDKTQPLQLKTARYVIVPEAITRVSMLKTGEADVITSLPPALVQDVTSTSKRRVEVVSTNEAVQYVMNTVFPGSPYADKRVRLAVNLAVDKESIVKNLLRGQGKPYSVAVASCLGYDANAEWGKPFPFDPKQAKQLLSDAGHGSGFDTTIWAPLGDRVPLITEYTQAIASNLRDVGIRAKTEMVEYAAWLKIAQHTDSSPMNGLAWTIDTVFQELLYHAQVQIKCDGSFSWSCDNTVDGLTQTVNRTIDPDQRAQVYKQLYQAIYNYVPHLSMYEVQASFGVNERVKWAPFKVGAGALSVPLWAMSVTG